MVDTVAERTSVASAMRIVGSVPLLAAVSESICVIDAPSFAGRFHCLAGGADCPVLVSPGVVAGFVVSAWLRRGRVPAREPCWAKTTVEAKNEFAIRSASNLAGREQRIPGNPFAAKSQGGTAISIVLHLARRAGSFLVCKAIVFSKMMKLCYRSCYP